MLARVTKFEYISFMSSNLIRNCSTIELLATRIINSVGCDRREGVNWKLLPSNLLVYGVGQFAYNALLPPDRSCPNQIPEQRAFKIIASVNTFQKKKYENGALIRHFCIRL